jgi:hypothetical protein
MNDLISSANGCDLVAQRKSGARMLLTVARVADHKDFTSIARGFGPVSVTMRLLD